MPYHVHSTKQILDFEEAVREIAEDSGTNLGPFLGAGTTGLVPDPIVENNHALSDTGVWRQATKVFFQSNQPNNIESTQGDLWLVLT